jgi:amino acid adenylation domain-containing protein
MLNLITTLKTNQIAIWAAGNDLELSFEDTMPSDEIIATIKEKKADIVQFLAANEIHSEQAFIRFGQSDDLATVQSNAVAQIEAIFPANSLQQGFVFHRLSQSLDDAYLLQSLLDYHTELNVDVYQQAWQLASVRYPTLRIGFDWGEKIIQVVTKEPSISDANFNIVDLTPLDENARDEAIGNIQRKDREQLFDLSKPGLIRFTLIKLQNNLFTVLVTLHHSISDGWSGAVLINTVHRYYDELMAGKTPKVETDKAYLAAQAYHSRQQGASEAYWVKAKKQFTRANDINAMLSRPIDLSHAKVVNHPANQTVTLGGQDYRQLKAMCQAQGITLNAALQFAWHKLLQSYTRDEQTIVGTTVSGRNIPVDGVESSVGLYINTLPLAVQWQPTARVADMLQHVQQQVAALNSYTSVSLADVQPDGARLFHSLFVFENYPEPDGDSPGIEGSMTFRQSVDKVDYPLSFMLYEANENGGKGFDSLGIKLNYGKDWLDDAQVVRLLEQMKQILVSIAADPTQRHSDISLLGQREHELLLHTWNQTEAPFEQDKTVHALFERQVEQTPDQIALVFDDPVEGSKELTYRQLNEQANQLAHAIRAEHVRLYQQPISPDTLIALYLDRSPSMVISILAVLKAGGAYVPVSPEYPQDRFEYIVQDSRAALVLSQQHYQQRLAGWLDDMTASPAVLAADDVATIGKMSTANLEAVSQPTDLAYVIYTSGTTGKPKGVMITHQSTAHLAAAQVSALRVDECQRALLFAAYVFDASVFELFVSLFEGLTVYLCNENQRKNPQKLGQLIKQQQIGFATLPPTMLSLLDEQDLSCLKTLVTAGESPSMDIMQRFSGNTRVFNAYGPTESTVCISANLFENGDLATNIGKPLNNLKVYVLDERLKPVPIGAPGELWAGGAGLARGYLNREDLTSQYFIDNPFATAQDKANGFTRLYRTGDLVRWSAEGDLEYLGRGDFQVKIRGHRIELGEVESALCELAGVKQAVVIDREQAGSQQLAAYLVSQSGETPALDGFKEALLAKLPDYMVPASFTLIDEVPLTINGKLDRKALPEPDLGNTQDVVKARNEREQQLLTLFSQILEVDNIGIFDNFFELGGHSFLAMRLISAVNEQMNTQLELNVLFDCPCVAQLAAAIEQADNSDSKAVEAVVQLQSGNDEPAIFMVAGTGGLLISFQPMVAALAEQRKVYGLQPAGTSDDETLTSISATAKYLIEQMKQVQSEGPYHFVGHSFGSFVVHEMARLLQLQGDEIGMVMVLDTHVPEAMTARTEKSDNQLAVEMLEDIRGFFGATDPFDALVFLALDDQQRVDFVQQMLADFGAVMTRQQVVDYIRVRNAQVTSIIDPAAGLSTDRFVVVKAKASAEDTTRTLPMDYGWTRKLQLPPTVVQVEGDHLSVLNPGHVEQVVELIEACFSSSTVSANG